MIPETPTKSILRCESLAGLLLRSFILSLAVGSMTVFSTILQNFLSQTPVTLISASSLFLTIWFPMVLSLFMSEFPRGDEFIFLRIGGATFCRTGMPLLVILLLSYSRPELLDQMVFLIGSVYAAGLIASILLSVFRLGNPSSRQNLNEVQSAIH